MAENALKVAQQYDARNPLSEERFKAEINKLRYNELAKLYEMLRKADDVHPRVFKILDNEFQQRGGR